MRRVLITGKGSYIGTKVEKWLKRKPNEYEVDVLDMIGNGWRDYNFHGYDSIFHVAGIAHRKNVSDETYEQVNHILAVEVARKAAEAGVKQFVFMSTGAVYSQSDKRHKNLVVNENSPFSPRTSYGISKLRAELDMKKIQGNMKMAILRPPTVYGPGAKGNYNRLSKIAKKSPFFPYIKNKRSMIYIDNLCEFVRLIINNESEGFFLPQNAEYVNTTEVVKIIAETNMHHIWITPVFNWFIAILGLIHDSVNKAVGTYYYENVLYFDGEYRIVDFRDSIIATEKKP